MTTDSSVSFNDLVIEKCVGDDEANVLSALGGLTFTQAFAHLYKPEDLAMFLAKSHSVEANRQHLNDRGFAAWLAKAKSGEAIGYIVVGRCGLPVPDMPENSGELLRFYVDAAYQGSGLGGQMKDLGLGWLGQHYDHIYLSVYAENHGAQRFYDRYGFEKMHEYLYMVGNQADPEFIMKRR